MNLHDKYFDKIGHFSLDRRMENLPTSETLMASLQRQLGLTKNGSESDVWSESDLYELIFESSRRDQIAKIFQNELSSPVSNKVLANKRNSASPFAFREYIKPIVPFVAGHIHSARSSLGTGSPWNPGRWLLEELTFGFETFEEYHSFSIKLADALKVNDTDKHELALYIRNSTKHFDFQINEKIITDSWNGNTKRNQFGWHVSDLHRNFIQLIHFVIDIKNEYSRYRWFLFLDAVLRLFSTISTLWRFKQTSHFIKCIEHSYEFNTFLLCTEIVKYGETRTKIVKSGIQEYIIKYLQIFHLCNDLSIDAHGYSSEDLFHLIKRNINSDTLRISEINSLKVIRDFKSEFDLKTSTLKNAKEFLEYVGVQKQDYSYKTVDYTYHYEKTGRDYRFAFGDALLIILVRYINKIKQSEITSTDFVETIAGLGIQIDYSEFSLGTLGKALQRLGLVEELSDSDSGMIFRAI
jgi:hypothetical protein